MRRMGLPCVRAAGLAALILWAPLVRGQEAPPAESGRSWSENSEFVVEMNGKPLPEARLYNARGRAAILIVVPGEDRAIVVDTGNRQVLTAESTAVTPSEEPDHVGLDDSLIGGEPSPFTMDKDTVVFFVSGKKYRLSRRPPMLGEVSAETLVTQIPAYRKGMEEYVPSPQDIIYLKDFPDRVRIEVFFGSWCPHCRAVVPRFIKSIREAGNANLQCNFTGVPSPFSDYPPAKEKQVRGVPTFIVYSGDQEIGRIGAFASDSSVEHELVKILYQWKQSRG